MDEYSDIMKRLEEMRTEYDAGFSFSNRDFLTQLNFRLFGKPITLTGCGDCYRDAYLLIYHKLKRDKKMPQMTNYRLRPGKVVHWFGTNEYYALDVSDEVAEKYLAEDSKNIIWFERYPEDWEARVTRRIAAEELKALGKEMASDTSEASEVNNDASVKSETVKTKKTRK